MTETTTITTIDHAGRPRFGALGNGVAVDTRDRVPGTDPTKVR
jgi:hypothetical protein